MILTVDYTGLYLLPSVLLALVLCLYTPVPTWGCIVIAIIGVTLTIYTVMKLDLPLSNREVYWRSVEKEKMKWLI